jgi:hypothetical protein
MAKRKRVSAKPQLKSLKTNHQTSLRGEFFLSS